MQENSPQGIHFAKTSGGGGGGGGCPQTLLEGAAYVPAAYSSHVGHELGNPSPNPGSTTA